MSSIAGLALTVASLLGASFANTVPQLIGTQGVLYAIGGVLFYSPVIVYMDEWFITRKGLAYGVMWAGSGVGGERPSRNEREIWLILGKDLFCRWF